ncbi:divalent-cation tolerance protein CutA [Wolbachia endosymbiont of Cruorifilaria tuberocauda]|uniref:divalent-cation tolerance protein CutA n=1 Tax=Wolbachia endosymbiont of Cruorifilaria tuberocauda TaxID=1812111 RepID=UPI001FEB2423|nr:divalent-cation tolerance protein CutA [Wolbachia endosymbiont of Cruorifilaria tuberocauda]
MSNIVLVYTTFSSLREAKAISKELLNKKLVVCINIFPKVSSLYLWKGEIQDNYETVAIMKGKSSKVDSIIKKIEAMHSYDQPSIIVIPIEVINKSFNDWVNNI